MNIETHFVEPVPRLAVSAAGVGELVLFLHGIRGERSNWNLQLPAFAKHFRAAAMDLRGYGDSEDYEGPLHFEHFAGDVLRVAEHFKSPKTHLVGLSMGGRVARNVAIHYPEHVKTLTLVSTNPGFDALSPEQVHQFVVERKSHSPEIVKRLLGSRARPGVFEELSASVERLHEKSYLMTLEASVAQDRGAPIEKISAPTLIVAGSDDRVYPIELPREMARRIPGAKLAIVEGAGHIVNMEQPERFNEIVLEFLLARR